MKRNTELEVNPSRECWEAPSLLKSRSQNKYSAIQCQSKVMISFCQQTILPNSQWIGTGPLCSRIAIVLREGDAFVGVPCLLEHLWKVIIACQSAKMSYGGHSCSMLTWSFLICFFDRMCLAQVELCRWTLFFLILILLLHIIWIEMPLLYMQELPVAFLSTLSTCISPACLEQ
jgi:hypothetical protein